MIGFRALHLAGPAERIGFYGFGAAAHIAIQVARYRGRQVYGFTRPGDQTGQQFARTLGATWAGGSDRDAPPSCSTPPSSLLRWANSCRARSRRWRRAVQSSAPASI